MSLVHLTPFPAPLFDFGIGKFSPLEIKVKIIFFSVSNWLIFLPPIVCFLNQLTTTLFLLFDKLVLYDGDAGADAEPCNSSVTVPFLSIIISFNLGKSSSFIVLKLPITTSSKNGITALFSKVSLPLLTFAGAELPA